MALSGIPIGINECIGDSLHTINAAFTALDDRTSSLSPSNTAGNVFLTTISGGNIIIGGNGTTTTVSGALVVTQGLTLSGNAFFNNNVSVSGNLTVDGVITGSLLSSTGDLVVDGNGFVAGTLTTCTLSATCEIVTDGDLVVLGDAYIHGKLTASELSSTGPLTVDGNTTLKQNLSVLGNTFLGDQCSDFTQIQGTLKLPCVNSQNAIEFNGESTSGTVAPLKDGVVFRYDTNLFGLNEDGLLIEKTDFNQNTPSGGIAVRNRGSGGVFSTTNDFAIRGDGKVGIKTWYPNKQLTVIGEISASNNVRFDRDLHVGGNTILGDGGNTTTIKDDLNILGDTTMSGDLRVEGNLTVLGDMTQLDTEVRITSAVDITNHGTTTALVINQTGNTPIVNFKDDGSSVFFIAGNTTDAGFVGLAQTNPTERLEVNGNIALTRNSSGFREIKITSSPANFTDLKINATNNTIIQETAGYVAIRRNSPASELDVNGDVTINNKIIHNGDTNTFIQFPSNGKFIVNTNGLERITVLADGKVGIGTPTPLFKLDVDGEIRVKNGYGNSFILGGDAGTNDFEIATDQLTNDTVTFLNRAGAVGDDNRYLKLTCRSLNLIQQQGSGLVPTGAIIYTSNNIVPFGYYKCDGSALVSSTVNDPLRNLLIGAGSPYGSSGGDPRVPDLRGIFIRGAGTNGSGVTGVNGKTGTFGNYQEDTYKNHNHPTFDATVNQEFHAFEHDDGFGINDVVANVNPQIRSDLGRGDGLNAVMTVAPKRATFKNPIVGVEVSTSTSDSGGIETVPANLSLTPIIKL